MPSRSDPASISVGSKRSGEQPLLHVRESGSSDRVVVLIHGMAGDGDDWAPVVPLLAELGYRVLAVDLPGHGFSPPMSGGTFERWAQAVADVGPAQPDLILGHSMGAVVLAAGVSTGALRPLRAGYVDAVFQVDEEDGDRPALVRLLTQMKQERTARAPGTARWAVEGTADVWVAAAGHDLTPPTDVVPSLMVRAEPSKYVTPEVTQDLLSRGFEVRSVAGATHNVWYEGREREFLVALDGWV